MLKRKDKTGNSSGVGKLGNRILRLFRPDRSCQASPMNSETRGQEVCYYSYRVLRNTLLEAEYKKARAIMELQKHQHLY